jgi:hypothetical protein
MKWLGWALFGDDLAYKHTWGACHCHALEVRLRAEIREKQLYQEECRFLYLRPSERR